MTVSKISQIPTTRRMVMAQRGLRYPMPGSASSPASSLACPHPSLGVPYAQQCGGVTPSHIAMVFLRVRKLVVACRRKSWPGKMAPFAETADHSYRSQLLDIYRASEDVASLEDTSRPGHDGR
jgi:hypothetical protein